MDHITLCISIVTVIIGIITRTITIIFSAICIVIITIIPHQRKRNLEYQKPSN